MTVHNMSKVKGILILECIDKNDPGSEGRFLSHMFSLMDVPSQYIEIRTKRQFVAMIEASPFNIVHITTHGYVTPKFDGFWTPAEEKLWIEDFSKDSLKGKTVVSTACRSGARKFARKFRKRVSAKYYIAPEGKPKFHNSIYFAHWFYHNVIVLKLSPTVAMKKYDEGYKNPHDFTLFDH
jgi:hypothetical protein